MTEKRDVFWNYFEALRLSGEDISFALVRLRGTQILERISFDHRRYDGVSALCEYISQKKYTKATPPNLRSKAEPTMTKKIIHLFNWYRHLWPGLGRGWQKRSSKAQQVGSQIMLTPEEWKGVQSQKPATVAVLEALDRVAQNYYLPSALPRLWMIPVGLYPMIDLSMSPSNRVSFVDMKLTGNKTEDQISTQLRDLLTQGQYWGSVLSLSIVHFFGVSLFSRLLALMPHFFRKTGTLTNVGQWEVPELEADESWSIAVTTVAISPVGASMLEINGKLALGIQFHKSLGWSPEQAESFAKEWKEQLLNQKHEIR
jgi:hypothetical protein